MHFADLVTVRPIPATGKGNPTPPTGKSAGSAFLQPSDVSIDFVGTEQEPDLLEWVDDRRAGRPANPHAEEVGCVHVPANLTVPPQVPVTDFGRLLAMLVASKEERSCVRSWERLRVQPPGMVAVVAQVPKSKSVVRKRVREFPLSRLARPVHYRLRT